jgi:hypothetical protein
MHPERATGSELSDSDFSCAQTVGAVATSDNTGHLTFAVQSNSEQIGRVSHPQRYVRFSLTSYGRVSVLGQDTRIDAIVKHLLLKIADHDFPAAMNTRVGETVLSLMKATDVLYREIYLLNVGDVAAAFNPATLEAYARSLKQALDTV